MTNSVRLTCSRCSGSGEVSLHTHSSRLAETWELLRTHGPMDAEEVYAASGIEEDQLGVHAFNRRLEALRALGLVRRTKDGRRWIYTAVVPELTQATGTDKG